MSPKTKVQKQEIIDAAFDIANEEGLREITVRKVANKLNCSVAPIYVNFVNAEELVDAVVEKAVEINMQMCMEEYTDQPFLNIGIRSVMVAYKYKRLYKDIIESRDLDRKHSKEIDTPLLEHMRKDRKLSGFNDKELMEILFTMQIFTNGLCVYAAAESMPEGMTIEYLLELLEQTGEDVIRGAHRRKRNLFKKTD